MHLASLAKKLGFPLMFLLPRGVTSTLPCLAASTSPPLVRSASALSCRGITGELRIDRTNHKLAVFNVFDHDILDTLDRVYQIGEVVVLPRLTVNFEIYSIAASYLIIYCNNKQASCPTNPLFLEKRWPSIPPARPAFGSLCMVRIEL